MTFRSFANILNYINKRWRGCMNKDSLYAVLKDEPDEIVEPLLQKLNSSSSTPTTTSVQWLVREVKNAPVVRIGDPKPSVRQAPVKTADPQFVKRCMELWHKRGQLTREQWDAELEKISRDVEL